LRQFAQGKAEADKERVKALRQQAKDFAILLKNLDRQKVSPWEGDRSVGSPLVTPLSLIAPHRTLTTGHRSGAERGAGAAAGAGQDGSGTVSDRCACLTSSL